MIGTTLEDFREHIENLASETGEYYLVCGRYGDRPVPAAGLCFERRSTARAAARATEQYRATLRRYDPQVPCYDVIVCQDCERPGCYGQADAEPRAEDRWALSEPVVTGAARDTNGRRRIEFCHRVAAAVFESLSAGDYDGVETAVLELYFELAESTADPDELCLCLLESMAEELSRGLSPEDQADVLSRAAARLGSRPDASDPVPAAFTDLREYGLVGEFAESRGGEGDWTVNLSGYALSPRDGRLPVFPLVVTLFRHGRYRRARTRAEPTDGGWRLALELGRTDASAGLATAPISP